MIGYSTIGTNNMEKAAAFYDALFAELGGKRTWDSDGFKAWANTPTGAFAISKPFDEKDATVGNGSMMALAAPDRETVDKMYAKAIELGATCEGKPGPRGGDDSAFYAGYFRDLDGNKLNFFHLRRD
ncbi:MAG: glyoxalase [Kordiimonadales bacterium]|nr:MAG: glyoxalase [Kordiimonadales bacterium]